MSTPIFNINADGTNGAITYAGKKFDVRVTKIDYNWEVIFTESHARAHRAFYPHQRAVARFALTMQFKGYAEYKDFVNYMWGYITAFVNTAQYSMFVQVPSFAFFRNGIPVGGIADTDHVGSMVFEPTIVFEAMDDPLDRQILDPQSKQVSQPGGGGADQAKFFYPFSAASENASLTTDHIYDVGSADQGVGSVLGEGSVGADLNTGAITGSF